MADPCHVVLLLIQLQLVLNGVLEAAFFDAHSPLVEIFSPDIQLKNLLILVFLPHLEPNSVAHIAIGVLLFPFVHMRELIHILPIGRRAVLERRLVNVVLLVDHWKDGGHLMDVLVA